MKEIKEREGKVMPQTNKTQGAGENLIIQMKKRIKTDERRYVDELQLPYNRGYLDGQKIMMKSVEAILRGEELDESVDPRTGGRLLRESQFHPARWFDDPFYASLSGGRLVRSGNN